MRVFLSNLGCKLNQAELEHLAREFSAAGHAIVGELRHADVHVVNSCTVTHVAARDSRKVARRATRLDPRIKTVLTGCYVNASAKEASALAGVDLIVPNEQKEDLVSRIELAFPELMLTRGTLAPPESPYAPLEFSNTRSLVKIEDGCNMPCAFCVIPETRGRQRSRPLDETVSDVQSLVAAGFNEVVITGVQISSYRWRGKGLFDLVTALLERTSVARLRLTSIAPWQFDQRLLDLFSSGRLCRHLHISLQSGCDDTLERMRRPYSSATFSRLLRLIRTRISGIAITTDVIVGFPGETDDEFEESLRFIESMEFARIHSFPFSPRPGTEAAAMPGQIAHQTKRKRMARMLAAGQNTEKAFQKGQLGSEVEILWEGQRGGHWVGMSDNYIRVSSSLPQQKGSLVRGLLARSLRDGAEVSMTDDPIDRSSPVRVVDSTTTPFL
jgi:threonylcarbamoyladenosine tRNA methylthiotransferase MtaB